MTAAIKKCRLFRGVDPAVIDRHTRSFGERTVKEGGVIFRAGTRGNALFIILSGKVGIRVKTSSGGTLLVDTLSAGEVFGELDLVDNGRRSTDAVAVTRCRVLRIPRRSLHAMLKDSRKLERNLFRMVAGRLRKSNIAALRREDEHLKSTRDRTRRFESVMDAAYLVHSSLNLRTLLTIILDTAVRLVNAERGTLYLIDREKQELCSRVVTGGKSIDIRLALGEGIAGHVARTGKVVNLTDAYADPRFNPGVDRVSGYVSRTMLCMPMQDSRGATIGVIQLLNKSGGPFDREDETFIGALSVHAAHAIGNARLAERMVDEERLSAVGRMAGAIVHDIKNPLNVMRLSAEVLAASVADTETREITNIMINQIDRFDSMAQEILEFSRGTSSLEVKPVEVEKIVGTVADIYSAEMKRRGVTLRKKLGYRGKVEVDFDKIVRCMQNLVGNALDAVPRGGTVGITTNRRGSYFGIEISDNGPGIPDEIRASLFEPFVTHGKNEGTGLGLAIVKKIAEDHGGTVRVSSKTGKGTKIGVSLPVRNRR